MDDGHARIAAADETGEPFGLHPAVRSVKLIAVHDGRIAAADHVRIETRQISHVDRSTGRLAGSSGGGGRRRRAPAAVQRIGHVDVPTLVYVDGAALLTRSPRTVGRAVELGTVLRKAHGGLETQHERDDARVDQQRQQRHEGDETGAGQQRADAQLVPAQVIEHAAATLHHRAAAAASAAAAVCAPRLQSAIARLALATVRHRPRDCHRPCVCVCVSVCTGAPRSSTAWPPPLSWPSSLRLSPHLNRCCPQRCTPSAPPLAATECWCNPQPINSAAAATAVTATATVESGHHPPTGPKWLI